MRAIVDTLASRGERWLVARGWRRTTMVVITVVAYVAFFLTAFFSGGVKPFFMTINFFLIGLAASTFGLRGGLAAATVSGILVGPLMTVFVRPEYGTEDLLWIVRFLVFELFGFLSGSVSSIFRLQLRTQRNTRDLFAQAQKMEAIGRLTGGIAHDFNNMLTAIGGYTQLLVFKTKPTDETKKLFDDLLEVVKRSASLTHQLLAISRKGNMEPRPVFLEEGIRSLAKMLRRIIGENVELKLELADDSWEVNVDPVQIDQVLMNLAVNAADAMPSGGILLLRTEQFTVDRVFLAQHPGLELGDYVMISVTDSGAGIPDDIAPYIFEPYFTTKGEGKGTGLGLSTAYGIVRQLKGDLWFYSERGHGTTFKICLPRAHKEEHPEGTNRLPAEAEPTKSGATIVIAEDDETVRTVMVELLKDNGYSVHAVADGEQALKIVENPEQTFDVLITDMIMPKVSGIEVIEAVYRLRPNAGVIVTSGYSRDERANMEISVLADKFLEKPFTGSRLLTMVRELL